MKRPELGRMPRPTMIETPGDQLAADVIAGLSQPRKTLPCRYFYDAAGSELFEAITRLPEYYPTVTETAILTAHASEIAGCVSAGSVLVEFGSGSSRKTEILLSKLPGVKAYVAIDVSRSALDDAAQRLRRHFPALEVLTVEADFSAPIDLPPHLAGCPRLGFFPGSTIGNLSSDEAARLLGHLRESLSTSGRLIVGVDLKKDPSRLIRAYNDAAGVTAAFNLNLLARINREIEPAFDLQTFRHQAIYDPVEGRIEMHLVSTVTQTITLLGRPFHFLAGETIHTENSYKYSIQEFRDLAISSGWHPEGCWTDSNNLFSVHLLAVR